MIANVPVTAQVVALAMGSALLLATTSILQHRAAGAVPHHKSLRFGLLCDLARNPLWLLGVAADGGAYLFQFLALRRGAIVLVQSVLVTGLLFALPVGAAASHRRLARRDWLGTVAVVTGLIVYLGTASPDRGRGQPRAMGWVILFSLVVGTVALLVVVAPPGPSKRRAFALGSACGVLFGLNAALTKACGSVLDHGGAGRLITSWQLWALIASASLGFMLAQSAFQAGPLEASLPVLTISDPLASSFIGLVFLHERIATSPAAMLTELFGAAVMVAGVLVLARSPLVHAVDEHPLISGVE